MSVGIILFNGIHYPFSVVSQATGWAIQSGSPLKAIFLQEKEKDEGYGFPSDLDEAQELSTTDDSNVSDERIIKSNMRMLEHEMKEKGVMIETVHLMDPTEEDLTGELKGAVRIFASERIDEFSVGSVTEFSVKEFLIKTDAPLHYVQEG